MSPIMLELLIQSLWETILMTAASGVVSLIFGLPLGLALVITSRGGIVENLWLNGVLGAIILASTINLVSQLASGGQ